MSYRREAPYKEARMATNIGNILLTFQDPMRRTSEAHAELNPEAGGEKVAIETTSENFRTCPGSKQHPT
jgi:hypothetical protein